MRFFLIVHFAQFSISPFLGLVGKLVRLECQEKLFRRQAQHPITLHAILTAIEQVTARVRIIFGEMFEARQVAGVDAFGVLDFDRMDTGFSTAGLRRSMRSASGYWWACKMATLSP